MPAFVMPMQAGANGQPTVSSGQFTGQQWDSAAGLIPFPARSYSPQLQRFLSEDPLGFGGGSPNLFQYAESSPVNFIDPSGTFAITSPEGIGTIVGGTVGLIIAAVVGTSFGLSAVVIFGALTAAQLLDIAGGALGAFIGSVIADNLSKNPTSAIQLGPIGPIGPIDQIGPLFGLGGGGGLGGGFLTTGLGFAAAPPAPSPSGDGLNYRATVVGDGASLSGFGS